MYHNFISPSINQALPHLARVVMRDGEVQGSRNGETRELTHVGITLTEPWKRELLMPYRKANLAAQIAETMWVLAGRDDLDFLSHYLPRARDFSDDGSTWRAGYGKRLRAWPRRDGSGDTIDQLRWVVDHLRDARASRRAVLNLWDPVVDEQDGKDIPCNNWLSFSSRLGKLDLMVAIRSNDLMWGWSGINAFEWSVLQEVVAGMLGVEVGGLHFATTSLHLYRQHYDKAEKIAEGQWAPVEPDGVRFDASVIDRDMDKFDALIERWFQLEYDIRTGSPMVSAYIDRFPEPMMRSWLYVLQWWWGHRGDPLSLAGERLRQAAQVAMQPRPVPSPESAAVEGTRGPLASGEAEGGIEASAFIVAVTELHTEKDAAYGTSWKRRGEMLGIMANIARKVDRLGQPETGDETSADTAIDLLVYLAKYHTWLTDERLDVGWHLSDNARFANLGLLGLDVEMNPRYSPLDPGSRSIAQDYLRGAFDGLEQAVMKPEQRTQRAAFVRSMSRKAYLLARTLWEAEQVEPEPDCTCAMSESSLRACPRHGEGARDH